MREKEVKTRKTNAIIQRIIREVDEVSTPFRCYNLVCFNPCQASGYAPLCITCLSCIFSGQSAKKIFSLNQAFSVTKP